MFLVDRSLLCCTLTFESIPKHLHCGSNLQMATQMICVGVGGTQICSNSTSYLNEMCTFAGVFFNAGFSPKILVTLLSRIDTLDGPAKEA